MLGLPGLYVPTPALTEPETTTQTRSLAAFPGPRVVQDYLNDHDTQNRILGYRKALPSLAAAPLPLWIPKQKQLTKHTQSTCNHARTEKKTMMHTHTRSFLEPLQDPSFPAELNSLSNVYVEGSSDLFTTGEWPAKPKIGCPEFNPPECSPPPPQNVW